jgi:hypothetical protein
MSLIYSNLLNSYVDWSDDEVSAKKKYLKWEELNINWEDLHLTWDEIFILLEVEDVINRGGGYGYKDYLDGNPWKQIRKEIGDEKTKRVIKLYCRINGVDYHENALINDSIKVSAYDFELFIKENIERTIRVKVDK